MDIEYHTELVQKRHLSKLVGLNYIQLGSSCTAYIFLNCQKQRLFN